MYKKECLGSFHFVLLQIVCLCHTIESYTTIFTGKSFTGPIKYTKAGVAYEYANAVITFYTDPFSNQDMFRIYVTANGPNPSQDVAPVEILSMSGDTSSNFPLNKSSFTHFIFAQNSTGTLSVYQSGSGAKTQTPLIPRAYYPYMDSLAYLIAYLNHPTGLTKIDHCASLVCFCKSNNRIYDPTRLHLPKQNPPPEMQPDDDAQKF